MSSAGIFQNVKNSGERNQQAEGRRGGVSQICVFSVWTNLGHTTSNLFAEMNEGKDKGQVFKVEAPLPITPAPGQGYFASSIAFSRPL